MKSIIVLIFLWCFPAFTCAQSTFSLAGKITTPQKSDRLIGDVVLFKHGAIIKYTSIYNGNFYFDQLKQGKYQLKIYSLGYKTLVRDLDLTKNTNLILALEDSSNVLDTVEVTATKTLIEYKNGHMIANVENTILSKESNSIDLLSKLPRVQIGADRTSISIIGKGNPLLYIGRQRISIEQFENLQIDDIKTIALINTPSAKYDADGRSVILITLRKNTNNGISLITTETAAFKTYFNNRFATNFTTKNNGLELKFNAAYKQLKIWESNGMEYSALEKNTSSNYHVEAVTTRPQFVFGAGFYYQLNSSDYISCNSSLKTQKDPFYIDTNTVLKTNETINNIESYSDNIGQRFFNSSNINYVNAIDSTRNLFIGLQHTAYSIKIDNTITNTYSNPIQKTALTRFQDFNVNVLSAKADYDISFKKESKLELGTNYTKTISGLFDDTQDTTSLYKYHEHNLAAYSQFTGKLKQLNYTLGLRIENTKVNAGYPQNTPNLINRDNTFLFPKSHINFPLGLNKTMTFTYAKSISRPNYSTAASTAAFINPVLEFRGNLALKPALTNEVSTVFQYKDKSLTATYTHIKHPVHYRLSYNETLSVMQPYNFNKEYGYTLELSYPVKYSFWTSTNQISLNLNTITDDKALQVKATPYWYIHTNHQFKINTTTSLNINGWALTNRHEGIFNRQAIYVINASFNKHITPKLDLTISANDIFNSMVYTDRYLYDAVKVKSVFYTDVNELSIALKYKIDTLKTVAFKNKNIDNEMNRIR